MNGLLLFSRPLFVSIMSTYYIDLKYASLLSSRLRNFKKNRGDTFQFSHDCESSSRGKFKSRAYFYKKGEQLNVFCHHCGYSVKLSTFLKAIDPNLYTDYRMEIFKDKNGSDRKETKLESTEEDIEDSAEPIVKKLNLNLVSDLSPGHPILKYVQGRCIPEEFYDKIGWCRDYNQFIRDNFDPKYKVFRGKPESSPPRLIFPFWDVDGTIITISGRAFGNEQPKYLKYNINAEKENIYGLWKVDYSDWIIAVEGQIDSLCVYNAVAIGGAHYTGKFITENKDNLIIVPDNDWIRNPQVGKSLGRTIKEGYSVAFLPPSIPWKDLNDCVVKGNFTPEDLRAMIVDSRQSGLRAELEFNNRKLW